MSETGIVISFDYNEVKFLTEGQIDRQTERQKDRKTERQRDRETERQRDRKTERQKDRQTLHFILNLCMGPISWSLSLHQSIKNTLAYWDHL